MFKRIFQKIKINARYKAYGKYKQLPTNLTESQSKLIQIFKEMLYNKLAKFEDGILYEEGTKNKKNVACIYYKQDDSIYYMFIEEESVRIINTIHGYDTDINIHIYEYMMWLYNNKRNMDFSKFVKESNKKVNHSMDVILEKVRSNKTDNQ